MDDRADGCKWDQSMDNEKMNKNRENLSDDDLREKMNFEKFMNEYKPVSFYKTWKFYAMAGLAALMISGTFLIYNADNDPVRNFGNSREETFINPPLQGVNVAYAVFELNAISDTILNYPNGSVLHVPSNAFLDQKGNPVKGKVELSYREFHDAADFFVSGIPMTYDSAGNRYHFESAGMFEIKAFKNGEALLANGNEQINIQMASDMNGSRFNIYFLDTAARRWEYMKEDVVLNAFQGITENERGIGPGVSSVVPPFAAPQKANSNNPRFDVAFDKKQFPELVVYGGVSFEVSKDEQNYDPKLAMTDWDNVKIERCPDGVHYLVTFSNRTESHPFKVLPVFAGTDYANALNLYNAKMKACEKERSANKKMQTSRGSSVRREFEVNRFGIWNSDCPSSLPKGKIIVAKFMDEQKNKLDLSHVYLVEKGKKAMFTYLPQTYKTFTYNPVSQNVVWGVTKENQLAIFNVDDFAKIKPDKDTSEFSMHITEMKITSVGEVRKLLGI